MKKLTKTWLMMLVITMCTGLTSCELFMSDNPTPTPSPTPTPTPTPPTYKSDAERPLTFEATVDGVIVTFKFKEGAKPDYKKVEFSLDGGATWTALSGPAQPILLEKAGDIVMFRGDNPTYNGDARFIVEQANSQARSNTRADEYSEEALGEIYGNLADLIKSNDLIDAVELVAANAGAFKELFKDAKIDMEMGGAPNDPRGHNLYLPSINKNVIVPDAFWGLFEGTLITTAPTVSVGTVAKGTMSRMFYNCPYLKEVTLELGSLAEGVTAKEAMGDMLGGNTGSQAEGGKLEIEYWYVDANGYRSPGTNPRIITLDDVVNVSGISPKVLDNATATIVDENGKASEPVKIETVTGLGLNVSHNGQDVSLIELTVGEKYECNINAYVKPETATDRSIVVYVENPRIAELKMGYGGTANPYTIIAYSPGETALTAAHGDFAITIQVIVYPAVESVTLNKSDLDLTVGDKEILTATIAPENARQYVTWTTNDAKVATVDKNGVVTAAAPGKTTITAKAGEKSISCTVTVKAKGPSIDDPDDYEKGGDPTAN